MFQNIRTAVILLLALTVVTGGLYPLAVTVFAQAFFPYQANGSLIRQDGRTVGSALIGQSFERPEYFWGRLSATSMFPYNAAASGGSNFGPNHPTLRVAVQTRLHQLQAFDVSPGENVPVDLVTSSASGLDPHISPAAAEYQLARIAKQRQMPDKQVRDLIRVHTEGRWLGVLGEPRVNVLQLNLALDQRQRDR